MNKSICNEVKAFFLYISYRITNTKKICSKHIFIFKYKCINLQTTSNFINTPKQQYL